MRASRAARAPQRRAPPADAACSTLTPPPLPPPLPPKADLPFTGAYKPEIGRFPSAAPEPTLTQAIGQSRGYEVRGGDKKE